MNERTRTILAPAKINLHLRVAAPDASGFHPLRSWMVTIGLYDRIEATIAPDARERVTLVVDGHPTLASEPTNLVTRAALALNPTVPLAIRLEKRVPIGAGLGGGSADAGATLVLVNDFLGLGKPIDELHAIAATLGSDVPFFLRGSSAIATGRGERLEPCPAPAFATHALLILPPFGVSTPAAYRTLDALRLTADPDVLDPFDVDGWAQLPAHKLLPQLVNDLELAAFTLEPRLDALRRDVERTLDRPVRMSGSGSTLFTLYDGATEAAAAAEALSGAASATGCEVRVTPIGRGRIAFQ